MSDDDAVAAGHPETPARPQLRVVRGEPGAEELAALLAVVAASGGDDADVPAPAARGRWNDPAGMTRRPLTPGPGGWRAAGR